MSFKYDRKNKTQTLMLLFAMGAVLAVIALVSSVVPSSQATDPVSTGSTPKVLTEEESIQEEQERTSKQAEFCSQSNAGTPEPAFTKAYEKCLEFTKNSTIEDFDKALSLTSG